MSAVGTAAAREIAFETLNRFKIKRHDASQILHEIIERTDEKQRATDLVFGTIRNLRAIDGVIESVGQVPIHRISKGVLNLIRMGAYELFYVPATAEYAIVSETVELAKVRLGKKHANFVNAILRRIQRDIVNRKAVLSDANRARVLPQTSEQGCEFNGEILPRFETNPAEYLSCAFSIPLWLIKQWADEFGMEQTKQICFASNRRASIYIRVNRLRTTVERVVELFEAKGLRCRVVPGTCMVQIRSGSAVSELPGYSEGFFTVQDLSAGRAAELLSAKSGGLIADLCAAPGGKTTQLVEIMKDEGRVIATDIDAKRLEKVVENCRRLRIGISQCVEYEKFGALVKEAGLFDAVLVDVPCSNTGVLARRSEVRLRITDEMIGHLAEIQQGLLNKAAEIPLKMGGKICYSTCSIQHQENRCIVDSFLSGRKDFELEAEKITLPSCGEFDCDGGYCAILLRK
ncbi:MAG: transcription antitermination factor NusB [Planctomycetota bacterium]